MVDFVVCALLVWFTTLNWKPLYKEIKYSRYVIVDMLLTNERVGSLFVCFFCPFLGGGKVEILEITTRRLKTTFYGHFSAKKQTGKWINHKDYLSDMINISLNNIDINMGKITPNRIAFVILPEEVTVVLYLLYTLLGAQEHIIQWSYGILYYATCVSLLGLNCRK